MYCGALDAPTGCGAGLTGTDIAGVDGCPEGSPLAALFI
jgi:hypothetical protein